MMFSTFITQFHIRETALTTIYMMRLQSRVWLYHWMFLRCRPVRDDLSNSAVVGVAFSPRFHMPEERGEGEEREWRDLGYDP
jgi:hypothetical protein